MTSNTGVIGSWGGGFMTSLEESAVAVQEILDAAPSVTVCGVTVPHNTVPWRVAINKHPELNGDSWGWIDGAPGNVCWSNSKAFNAKAAGQMVAEHAQWLEDQKPLSIRLVEAREQYAVVKRKYDETALAHDKAKAALIAAQERIAALAKCDHNH